MQLAACRGACLRLAIGELYAPATNPVDIADKVESTYLGELNYTDGAPTAETHTKVQDFVQVSNAVRVFLSGIPVASIQGLLLGHESIGMKPNQTIAISEDNLDANSLWLTANTTTCSLTKAYH